ncbi:MAG: hypothetical protein RI539_04035 [Spiribacter sp.]|jgi:HPr kinase/phosphorylase|nr:hypothetical protein [Spiribacter sp.]MDR9489499.1 hypothetical protein [Spiribacter sp.]
MNSIPATLIALEDCGVLLRGQAGSGKSDTALALVAAGHQLVADDAVRLQRTHQQLRGSAPANGRGLIYIRSLGLIDVRRVFGNNAYRDSVAIELIVDLHSNPKDTALLGGELSTEIAGVKRPRLVLACHRPIAALIRVAVTRMRAGLSEREAVLCD